MARYGTVELVGMGGALLGAYVVPPDRDVCYRMPLRIVVLARFGPPAGGFRIAFKPGLLNWPEGFSALEASLRESVQYIASLTAERRRRLFQGEEQAPDTFAPRIHGREGGVHVSGAFHDNGAADLVLRASFAFRAWPFGEWVVYDGMHIDPDGRITPFTDSEVADMW